jgi:hypothetical protein
MQDTLATFVALKNEGLEKILAGFDQLLTCVIANA